MEKPKKPYDKEKTVGMNAAITDISILHQKYPKATYTVVSQSGPVHEPNFIAECRIDEKNVFYGEGKSKQKAKQDAAANALKFIVSSNANGESKPSEAATKNPPTPSKSEPLTDKVHVGIVFQHLHPDLNFIWSKGSDLNRHVGEIVVNGKTFKDESSSKKLTKVKLTVAILKEMHNINCITMSDKNAYVENSDWKKIRAKKHKPTPMRPVKSEQLTSIPPVCGQKHPIQFLYEIYTTLDYKEMNISDPSGIKYRCTLDLENETFVGEALTRKIAKLNCAINTINGLLEMGILQQRLEIKEMNKDMLRKHKLAKKEKYLMKQDTRLKYQGDGMKKFKFVDFKKSETLMPGRGMVSNPSIYPSHHANSSVAGAGNNFFAGHANEQSYNLRMPSSFLSMENQNTNVLQQQPFVKTEYNQHGYIKSEYHSPQPASSSYAANSYSNNERIYHHHHHHHQPQQQQQYHFNNQQAHEAVYNSYSNYNATAGSAVSNRIPFNY
ncbi:hypothetical protein HELRODRAFT_167782 [Helobdella robusta]|uniref:DRBM domain-containing protein n=1 Tax=Helobdella robusta TaxID=6412 RepID=T1EZS8_HELRO|nr:hypothetical protein HELRODRAFT_167782 [Helobdella robusta]ESO09952.1 hypothetical protein HELRODRAFT_167782 [Helobdella robusta]